MAKILYFFSFVSADSSCINISDNMYFVMFIICAVLEVSEGVFQVLSTCGDTHLGGDDFDKV